MINEVLTGVFIVEMVIKLFGFGVKNYFGDYFNRFDFVIVLISVIDLLLVSYLLLSSDVKQRGSGVMTVFRALRMLRIFKLTKKWKSFRVILRKASQSLADICTFAILMIIFMVVFVILGM